MTATTWSRLLSRCTAALVIAMCIGSLSPRVLAEDTTATRLPFAVGEGAVYRASFSIFGRVGTGTMEVASIDTIRGQSAFRLVFQVKGGIPGARVDNQWVSWFDVEDLFSHRFVQRTREVRFRRDRQRDFYPRESRWSGHTNGREESGTLPTSIPLDDVSFLYYVRTMQLEVGQEYVLDRYWDAKGNPVRLKVLRRDTIRVPIGTFATIVVQPLIRTSGLFSEGGEAEVHFSEGPARELIMLQAKVSFGTLRLQLESFRSAGIERIDGGSAGSDNREDAERYE